MGLGAGGRHPGWRTGARRKLGAFEDGETEGETEGETKGQMRVRSVVVDMMGRYRK